MIQAFRTINRIVGGLSSSKEIFQFQGVELSDELSRSRDQLISSLREGRFDPMDLELAISHLSDEEAKAVFLAVAASDFGRFSSICSGVLTSWNDFLDREGLNSGWM